MAQNLSAPVIEARAITVRIASARKRSSRRRIASWTAVSALSTKAIESHRTIVTSAG